MRKRWEKERKGNVMSFLKVLEIRYAKYVKQVLGDNRPVEMALRDADGRWHATKVDMSGQVAASFTIAEDLLYPITKDRIGRPYWLKRAPENIRPLDWLSIAGVPWEVKLLDAHAGEILLNSPGYLDHRVSFNYLEKTHWVWWHSSDAKVIPYSMNAINAFAWTGNPTPPPEQHYSQPAMDRIVEKYSANAAAPDYSQTIKAHEAAAIAALRKRMAYAREWPRCKCGGQVNPLAWSMAGVLGVVTTYAALYCDSHPDVRQRKDLAL